MVTLPAPLSAPLTSSWSISKPSALNDDTLILTETNTETFFRYQIFRSRNFFSETKVSETETLFSRPNFPKPKQRLVLRDPILRNRNRNPQKIGKSLKTEKFRNRNVNVWPSVQYILTWWRRVCRTYLCENMFIWSSKTSFWWWIHTVCHAMTEDPIEAKTISSLRHIYSCCQNCTCLIGRYYQPDCFSFFAFLLTDQIHCQFFVEKLWHNGVQW